MSGDGVVVAVAVAGVAAAVDVAVVGAGFAADSTCI